jgi:hypothetical protein
MINSPEIPVFLLMEQAPAPATEQGAGACGAQGAGVSLDRADTAPKKDWYSKICTAGGMRDRRMRLSLDVARKFFQLQDMLGFDKASKTVQWLINTSKAAIQEIMADDASSDYVEDGPSSLSVDGKYNPAELGGGNEKSNGNARSEWNKPTILVRKAATTAKPPRKSGNNAHPVPDKETRAKARERARERTKEKHRMRWVKLASAIDVEVAAASVASDRPSSNNLSHHSLSSMNIPRAAAAELEERERSLLAPNNRGRMQEITGASDVVGFGNGGGYGCDDGNYYCQEQWELGGVVFQQNSGFY